jgi:hypothetical protein
MDIDQIGIALFGALAVWLSQERRESYRRWACIFGMLGQPFWLYNSWVAEQWGIFAISILYVVVWMRGIWLHWLVPQVQSQQLVSSTLAWQGPSNAQVAPRATPKAALKVQEHADDKAIPRKKSFESV